MAITKKYLNEMFGTVLVLSALLSTVTAVDCNGKSFHCVNSTHFMICVDLGGGVSQAIDNFLVACPRPTVCQGTNHFECEYPAPITSSTTLSNVFTETTQPWEDVVTVSSTGNITKEFSENYMNTERITTTAEYSVTTDTTVDLTTATVSEGNVNNNLNIPEIVPTLAAEIATSAIETSTTLNDNLNIIEYVPTEVPVAITTAVIETVTQTTAESRNLTETGPVFVDETTTMAAETTTENIIMTDTVAAEIGYIAPSATEQVPQTIHENLNITETEPTGVVKDITTTIMETEHVVVDEIPTTTTETIIITDSLGTTLGYTEPTSTHEVTQTTNDNLLELETVQSITEPYTTAINITESNLDKVLISETKNASKTDSVLQNILPIQSTPMVETIVETTTGSIEHLTAIPIGITDDFTTAPPLESKIKESESINVSASSKPLSSFDGSDRPNASIKGNKQSAAKELENKETLMPTINDAVSLYNSSAARNRTEEQANTTDKRVFVSNINSTTLPAIIITDVAYVYDHDAKENNIEKPITSTASNITKSHLGKVLISETKNATKKDTVVQNILPIQTTSTVETIVETTTGSIEHLTTILVDSITDDFTTAPPLDTKIKESESINVSESSKPLSSFDGSDRPIASIKGNKQSAAKELENKETLMPTINDAVSLYNSSAARNRTEEQANTTDKRVFVSNINSTTLPAIIITDVPYVYDHDAKENNIEKPITSTASNITKSNLDKVLISETKNASKKDTVVQNILPIQTTSTVETIVETTTGNIEHLTTIPVDSITDDFTTAPPLDSKIKESESINVSEPSKPLSSFDGSDQPNASIKGTKQSAAKEIENKETKMPTINEPVTPYKGAAARNRTEKQANTTDERVVVSNINLTTLPVIVITDAPYVYDHDAKENNVYTTTNISLHENKFTTVTNVPTENTLIVKTSTLNPAEATVLDGTLTEMIDNAASTEQPTTINEGSLTTESTQNIVTEYNIVPTSQTVNLEIITTDVVPTTVNDVQSMPPDFEDNMNNDPQLHITEKIVSTVNNGATTNDSMTVDSINMDTITTVILDLPATISDAHLTLPAFEDNMKLETLLPVTENIVSKVTNQVSTNGFMTTQAVNIDTITTETVGIPIAISNNQSILATFDDGMKIEAPFGNALAAATENTVTTANNKVDTNDFIDAQAFDFDTISTDSIYKLTTVTNDQALGFVDIMKTEVPLPATENVVFSINNGDSTNGFMTEQPVNVDIINTEALYGAHTTISNAQPMRPTFENNITTVTPLAATEKIVSSVNYGVSTNDFTTDKPVNVDEVNTEGTQKSTTISNAPPKVPTIEDNLTTDISLLSTENIFSSVNNGASTNGFMTIPAVNVNIKKTQATINNTSTIAPAFDDSTMTETPLPATKDILSAINNEISTNSLPATKPSTLDQITRKAVLETVVQLTTNTYTVPSSKVIELSLNNEKAEQTVQADIIKAESGTSVPDIIKGSPNNTIQNTQTIINSSTSTAVESHVKENYEDNKMTTIAANNIYKTADNRGEYLPDFSLSKNTPTAGLAINESTSHVSPIENVTEQTSVYNDATSQKDASPVNDNIIKATTRKSTPDLSFHPAFDISNQNLMNPQVQSTNGLTTQVTNNLQTGTIERNDQADNIIWNPLAGQVFNNPNQNSESSVTNTNVEHNDRDATSLNKENISQQATTSSAITVSPIYAHIDHGESIDSITTQSSIGITDANDNLATKKHSENIAKVNSEHETDYRPNIQSEIPITISFNQKTDKLATAEVDVLSLTTTLPAKTSGADTTTPESFKNTYETIDSPFSSSLGSTFVETDNTLRKSESNAEVFLDHKENNNVTSNQDPSIISISITNDKISEVKSSVVIGGNIDSPTVVHNNGLKLPTSSHGFSGPTRIGTTMEGNKVNEEDTLSKSVMLDILPLPINNIQFNDSITNIPASTDFISNSPAENTVIITESYKSATSRPSFVETKIQDSVKVGVISTVPKMKEPAFNVQTGLTDRTSDTTTVPKVGSSTSNSKTIVFANTVAKNGDPTFNSQAKSIDERSDALSQPLHIDKIPNKKTIAPNNAYVIPDIKSSGSGINAGNIHSPTTSDNVNRGIMTPESVSNYESYKSVNLTLHESLSSRVYQKSNTTVVTDLKSASQNISFNTEKAPQKSIGSDNMQSEVTHQNNSTNITISKKAPKIPTSTIQTPSQMVTPTPIPHFNNNLNKQVPTDAAQTFACIIGVRGRYSDKDDCRKFYICIGNNEPIVGHCPENTVFSDLKKLCTKNMSHCIRENQFKCPSAGRFSDFLKDNVYYICINHNTKLYKFKFQCQKGYILDKTKVHCIETKEIESNESVSISSGDNSSQTSSSAISSNTSSKSISTNSKSNSSSRPDNGNSKNDNSSKSIISNEAVETSEKSEGNDDDDDEEVFQCKKEGKYPIPNECRRYYLCKKNRKSDYRRKIKKCNSGKVFHKDKKKCVDDDSYEC